VDFDDRYLAGPIAIRSSCDRARRPAAGLGNIPGTDQPYFRTDDPADPTYDEKLDLLLPRPGHVGARGTRWLLRVIASGFGRRTDGTRGRPVACRPAGRRDQGRQTHRPACACG
jgi:hypothetical protein